MTARQRSAGLALFVALACLTAVLAAALGGVWAGQRPVPARTAQGTSPASPEPPGSDLVPGSPCPVDPPTPVVALSIRVPAAVAAGQEIEYHICVENCSPAAAHHVMVRDPLPGNVRFVRATPEPAARDPELIWQLGTLEACACREIVLVLAPTGPGEVKNCARVQFEHGQCVATRVGGIHAPPPPVAMPPAEAPPSVPPQAARPELTLRKVGPSQAVLYDAIRFHVILRNEGTAAATGVVVTDTLPAGLEHSSGKNPLTWEVGTLAPGKGFHIEYEVISKAAGKLCNQATLTAAGGVKQEASSCVVVSEPKLELSMTGPERHPANLPAKYEIVVSNPGGAPATNVTITDTLPAQTTFVSASEGGKADGNQVQWQIGTLTAGAQRTVQIILQAQAAGEVRNQAAATADRDLKAQAEVRTVFQGGSGLTFNIVDTDDPVEAGKETTYIVTIVNQGNVPATKLTLAAVVPEQLAVIRTDPPPTRQDGQKLTYETAALQPGVAVSYRVVVKARQAGVGVFKADLGAEQLTAGPVHREETTTVYEGTPAVRPQPPAGP